MRVLRFGSLAVAVALAWLAAMGGCPSEVNIDVGGVDVGAGGTDDASGGSQRGDDSGGTQSGDDTSGGRDDGARPSPSGTGIGGLADDGVSGGAAGGSMDDSGSGTGSSGGGGSDDIGGGAGSGGSGGDDPDAGSTDGSGGDDLLAASTFTGTLERVTIETISQDPNNSQQGSPRTSSLSLTQEFNAAGFPVRLHIPGYSDSPDAYTTVNEAGESETIEQTSGTREIRLVVTVRRATYASESARIDLDIDYEATQGQLVQRGAGTHTVRVTLDSDGARIRYESQTHYEIDLVVGTLTVSTTADIDCSGNLARQ